MRTTLRRGARATAPLAVALAVAALTAACSSGNRTISAPAFSPSPSAVAATSAATATVLKRAETKLAAERSYAYAAFETVQAKTPTTTRVNGVVVRGQGVAYTLTVGSVRTQVVRLHGATYVRKLPGRWARLHTAHQVADPVRTLDAVLRGLSGAVATSPSTVGTSVAGQLPPAAAKSAGIPTDGTPAQVVVGIDPAGHVTRLTVHTVTTAGATHVAVTLDTRYSRFGDVRPIRKPV